MDERARGLAAALDQIRGVDIDEAAARVHVMRPDYLRGVTSDRGREGVPVKRWLWRRRRCRCLPLRRNRFIRALEEQLTGNVAGYSIRLTENGSTIAVAGQNWAKRAAGRQPELDAGYPDARREPEQDRDRDRDDQVLDAGRAPAQHADHRLPARVLGQGPNVDQITFAELMTHRSGLAFGATNSRSDFKWMKAQIAAGTTRIGEYSYQNMNFGLCRILLATINGNIPVDWTLPSGSAGCSAPSSPISSGTSSRSGPTRRTRLSQVFAPADVTGPDLTHDAADALAYNFPVTGNGWNSGDLTSMASGAGMAHVGR